MATAAAGPAPHQLRALSRSVAAAGDEQVRRVVATVDGLGERGEADRLIAPLRARLAALQPPRPLRFARLLFLPLNPLIVAAPRWRPGSATVPRTALVPLAKAVRDALGAAAVAIDSEIAGHTLEDREIVARAGETLWPLAGAILAASPLLPGWADTGLPEATAAGLSRAVGAVLPAVLPLRRLCAEAEIGVPLQPEPVQAVLALVAPAGNEALAMAMAVLLAWLPQAAALLPRGASALGPDGAALSRRAAGQAIGVLLDRLETEGGTEALIDATCLDELGAVVRRVATLLDGLDEATARAQRQRVAAIRGRMQQSCQSRFLRGLETGLAGPLQVMASSGGASRTPATVAGVEQAARCLRQVETAARRFGGGAFYDARLRGTAAAIRAGSAGTALSLVDKVRLVEILEGPDAADALLEERVPAYRAQSADPRLDASLPGAV